MPATEPLAAGPWRATVSLGEVGHISHDGHEVVRAVRVVARDADWNTFPHRAGPVEVVADGFRFRIDIHDDDAGDGAVVGVGAGAPLATADVTIRLGTDCVVSAEIRPARDLDVNRLGLVVLLSPDLAGTPLDVEHAAAPPTSTAFPERIAPHQPARDIRALRFTAGRTPVTVTLTGDVFEMEDQRNWTDASFKVYNRPLGLPFPYRVGPEEPVEQSVRIAVGEDVTVRDRPAAPDAVPDVRAAAGRPAEIGTSSSRHVTGPLPPPAPGAGPLLVEVTADRSSWPEVLGRAAREAEALGVPVDLRIVAAGPDDLTAALDATRALPLARVGVFDPDTHVTEAPVWDALRRWRDGRPAPLPLVAGTRAHFTELNRTVDRLPRDADLVAFSITPMMHATDPEHVEESLAMQTLVAQGAVALADGIPVVIGPVTFRRRFNAVATTPSPGSLVEAARGVDELIGSEYAASWLTRSVDAVSVPGVLAATWFEATGPRGLVTTSGDLTPAGRAWYALVG